MKQKKILGVLLAFVLVLVSVFGNVSAEVSAATKVKLNKPEVSMKVGSKYHKRELKQAILIKLPYGTHHFYLSGAASFLINSVNIFYL